MKCSIFSVFSLVLSVSALAHVAQAAPHANASFDVHTLRLSELTTRNKSDFKLQPFRLSELDSRGKSQKSAETSFPYAQAPTQTLGTQTSEWPDSQRETAADAFNAETVTSTVADNADDTISQALSITQKRLQLLNRS